MSVFPLVHFMSEGMICSYYFLYNYPEYLSRPDQGLAVRICAEWICAYGQSPFQAMNCDIDYGPRRWCPFFVRLRIC